MPGFNGLYMGRAQLAVLGNTKTIGANAVNEFRLSYTRDANDLVKPAGGLGVSFASQGFVTGEGTLGIVPLAPENQGVAPLFNTSLFGLPPLGSVGNSGRRLFSGPGIANYGLTVQKSVKLTESKSLEVRVEAFNAFNHAQFYGPSSVDGTLAALPLVQVVSAAPPRQLQLALKIFF